MVHGPSHVAPVHSGVGVASGVGLTGTHAQLPDPVISHCPGNTGTSGPLHIPGRAHGGGGNEIVQGPLHAAPEHCGVGVGSGVGPIGIHSQLPVDVDSHCPNCTGHGEPPVHENEMMQSPPQGNALHGGVGVANGVGRTGTHAHSPGALDSHCPS